MGMKRRWLIVIIFLIIGALIGIYVLYRTFFIPNHRLRKVIEFISNPDKQAESVLPALLRCGDAPFVLPSSGMIGFLWGDSFRPGHRHQRIDIFSGTEVGITPVYAAFDGYLTREADWKSTLIIRIPSNPINPNQQIWTYYTHLAEPSGESLIVDVFPPGTREVFVSAGTLLGYQGNYSGTPGRPTGVHLHFSVIKDDGQGGYKNELKFHNTLDPSPYFGMNLNASQNPVGFPVCDYP